MAQNKYPVLALRSSTGVEVWKTTGPTAIYAQDGTFKRDESKMCRAIVFSPDGRFLAWANGTTVQLAAVADNFRQIASLPRPKAFFLKFSPQSNYLMTWELFTTTPTNPEGTANLHIYRTSTGELVFSTVQKRQSDWEPHWSTDESIVAMMIGGEVYFYELNGDGFAKAAHKLGGGRNGGVSLSPGPSPHIGFYVPGVKGAPSNCKVFKYPAIEGAPVASKSFFNADKVEMIWNKRGTGMILLTSTEVDQTGVSYYGKQALHFINTKGDSFAVQLDAEGPIHSVAWSPKSTDFCVVYGFMPAKATLFNLKCDRVFDFGTGSRNAIYYNQHGNLLLFGGFGNLRGNIEVWDMDKRKQISTSQAPDTTLLEWSPVGDTYFTATCAPRLRIGNGFKVWHYTGALLHETHWPDKQELWELTWQCSTDGTWPAPVVSNAKIEGIQSTQAQASKQKYVPPCIRDNLTASPAAEAIAAGERYIPGLPPGYRSSKQAAAGKRTNNNRRPRSQKNSESEANGTNGKTADDGNNKNKNNKPRPKTAPAADQISEASPKTEKDPKIPKIHKKLREIRNLKEKQEKGEKLDPNQLAKLQTELELVKELTALKLVEKQQKQPQPPQPAKESP